MKFLNSIHSQINLWQVLASVLPLTTIFFLAFVYYLGWTDFFEKVVIITSTALFLIATLWWWWVMAKIKKFADLMDSTDASLCAIKEEIQYIRDDIKE